METLTEQPPVQSEVVPAAASRPVPWIALAWFSALLIGAFFPILRKLVDQWMNDDDVSHGFFVPIVALYIAWQRRDALLSLNTKPSWVGAALMIWAALQAYIGAMGAELFLQRSAFLEAVVGLLLLVGGWALIRELLFPLALLPFMIPIPTVVYSQITFPLQLFASQVAEICLTAINIPVLRDGNVLELASQKLSVAEACSGIRSLLTLTFLSLVYAYVFDKKVWMRWVLLLCTIPIAIIANAGRVTITGILSEIDTKLAEGIFHEMEGWVIFVIAFAMLAATHAMINWAYRIRRDWHKPIAQDPEDATA
ncbi:MAG: exosortase/archaeosortase family protein [Acidobacteriota bacterium]